MPLLTGTQCAMLHLYGKKKIRRYQAEEVAFAQDQEASCREGDDARSQGREAPLASYPE